MLFFGLVASFHSKSPDILYMYVCTVMKYMTYLKSQCQGHNMHAPCELDDSLEVIGSKITSGCIVLIQNCKFFSYKILCSFLDIFICVLHAIIFITMLLYVITQGDTFLIIDQNVRDKCVIFFFRNNWFFSTVMWQMIYSLYIFFYLKFYWNMTTYILKIYIVNSVTFSFKSLFNHHCGDFCFILYQ